MEHNASTSLYNLLVTRDFDPEILDSKGKAVMDPSEAELFSFDWKTEDKNYGTVVLLINSDNELEMYFGDNLGRAMESDDRKQWYEFLNQVKKFATSNLLTFRPQNLNRLKYTMQGMAAIKEGLFEGYYGTRKVSYSDQPKKTKLVIKHDRPLGEGDARFRHIDRLFVETEEGARFPLPFKNLMAGKAMARHCAEGGTPYDAFGQHITQMVAEMNTLARFVRAARNKTWDDDTQSLVESAIRHYSDLKAKAKRMISQRGYREEREQFDPAAFTDSEVTAESIRDMFLEQSLDQRIEEALPILARIAGTAALNAISNRSETPESQDFEHWADGLVEGTWALPDDADQQRELATLMRQPLPVGPDATNATEQLYDLVGDDELFDRLARLADQDPDADARPVVQARLAELGMDIDFQPEPKSQAGMGVDVGEDLDVDGVMMTRPSNMSSESIERHLGRLLELAKSQ
jgi:hypothetical protein